MQGWECPKCHAVWGPFVHRCHNCRGWLMLTVDSVAACEHMIEETSGGRRCVKCGYIPFDGVTWTTSTNVAYSFQPHVHCPDCGADWTLGFVKLSCKACMARPEDEERP